LLLSYQAKWLIFISVILIGIVWLLGDILLPFLIGAAIAYFLNPVADKLEKVGINRFFSTIIIFGTFLLCLLLFSVLALPKIANEIFSFLENAPEIIKKLITLFENNFGQFFDLHNWEGPIDTIKSSIQSNAVGVLKNFYSSAMSAVDTFMIIFISPIVAIYLLYDWNKILLRIGHLIPLNFKTTIYEICLEIDLTLSKFIRGQIIVCCILGIFYAVTLSLVGLNYGIFVGLVAGFLSFIPYLGAIFGGALALSLALYQFWPEPYSIALIGFVFLIGQLIEGNYLTPKIVGTSIGLHPVWLLFSLSFFGTILGFSGLLLAVPFSASFGVIVRFLIKKYKVSALYLGTEGD
jgi:predicted PurR-regulated permease PerM